MKDIKVGVKKMTRNRHKMIEQTGTLYFCQNIAFNFRLSSYYSLFTSCISKNKIATYLMTQWAVKIIQILLENDLSYIVVSLLKVENGAV